MLHDPAFSSAPFARSGSWGAPCPALHLRFQHGGTKGTEASRRMEGSGSQASPTPNLRDSLQAALGGYTHSADREGRAAPRRRTRITARPHSPHWEGRAAPQRRRPPVSPGWGVPPQAGGRAPPFPHKKKERHGDLAGGNKVQRRDAREGVLQGVCRVFVVERLGTYDTLASSDLARMQDGGEMGEMAFLGRSPSSRPRSEPPALGGVVTEARLAGPSGKTPPAGPKTTDQTPERG